MVKMCSEPDMRTAVYRLIEYSELFNDFTFQLAGFKPFGNLRGFKGRAEPLNKTTTKWLLKRNENAALILVAKDY